MLLLVSGPLSRRSALCAALLTPLAPPCRPRSASAAGDVLYNLPMYCVPGVTSDRCRGVFWETGKLYKKDSSSQELKDDEYGALLASLRAQRRTRAHEHGNSGASIAFLYVFRTLHFPYAPPFPRSNIRCLLALTLALP